MFSNLLKNISPVVKNLLLINILFYIAQWTIPSFTQNLELYPISSEDFKPWQLATHFFMHSPYSIGHIFFNMFALVIFGSQLERVWGAQRFLGYYISCALGAAVLHLGVNYYRIHIIEINLSLEDLELFRNAAYEAFQKGMNFKDPVLAQLNLLHHTPMLGASGAVFGLLAAFGYLFPNTELMLLFPPIPIKAKYFVIGYAALELYLGVSNNPSDNVAHFAHLGGALVGIIIVLYWGKNRNSFF
ncbi:MAG: rhomboid family intramembrane serine protease [Crocinitomicaceae bacterium]|nr:rhomboid family intramembrane serine protease [Crocinitomicaceae bacterium]|tara:strand:- start:1546 stop:2277 length:732 start_codon:yes stop_codon:yes gene_type:complete